MEATHGEKKSSQIIASTTLCRYKYPRRNYFGIISILKSSDKIKPCRFTNSTCNPIQSYMQPSCRSWFIIVIRACLVLTFAFIEGTVFVIVIHRNGIYRFSLKRIVKLYLLLIWESWFQQTMRTPTDSVPTLYCSTIILRVMINPTLSEVKICQAGSSIVTR